MLYAGYVTHTASKTSSLGVLYATSSGTKLCIFIKTGRKLSISPTGYVHTITTNLGKALSLVVWSTAKSLSGLVYARLIVPSAYRSALDRRYALSACSFTPATAKKRRYGYALLSHVKFVFIFLFVFSFYLLYHVKRRNLACDASRRLPLGAFSTRDPVVTVSCLFADSAKLHSTDHERRPVPLASSKSKHGPGDVKEGAFYGNALSFSYHIYYMVT